MNNPYDQDPNILNVNYNPGGFPNPNSTSTFADGNQNPTNPKKKKKKKAKHLERKNETEADEGAFNLYKLGDVKLAEIHSSANRPLRKLNEPDGNCTFCPCCYLPAEKENYLVQFKTCDNPDDFYDSGQGVVLYYSFIKFCIMVMAVTCVCMCIFNIYYSFKYTQELENVCNNIYKNGGGYYEACKLFTTEADENDENSEYARVDSIFFIFSSVNAKYYRDFYSGTSTEKSNSFDSTVVNMSRINFFCLLFTFVFNLVFIYFLFNKANAADYLSFTISDYSIFLYNLYDVHEKFLNNFKEIEAKRVRNQSQGKLFDEVAEYKSRFGYIPNMNDTKEQQFKNFLQCKICEGKFGETFKIAKVDLCYKLEEIMKLQEELKAKNEKITRVENDPNQIKKNKEKNLEGDNRNYYGGFLSCYKEENLGTLREEEEKKQSEIDTLIENSKQNTLEYFGGAAFITFESIKEQELYLKNVPNNSIEYFFRFLRNMTYYLCPCCVNKNSLNYLKRNVKFEAAPEPEDIIFENLEVKPFSRIMRTVLVYIISIIICGVSFAIIVALNKVQANIDNNNNSSHLLLLYIMSLVITGITTGIDVILESVLDFLTRKERQMAMTDYYLSYSVKLTLFTFLNGSVLPLVSELAFDKSDGYEILISNMLMKFLVNAFVTPALWTINFGYFFKKFQICLLERNVTKNNKGEIVEQNKEEIGKTQKELNDLYELPPMNIAIKYSYIAKTLLMSFLYIPIFPLGLIISFVGLLLGYWLEKFNFANMYKKPEMLNRQLAEFYVSYFIVVFFAYGVGDYIFLKDVYDSKIWSLINIIAFGILIIIPYHRLLIIEYFDVEESEMNNKKYNDAYLSFRIDYERANPMTKKEGTINYLNRLRNENRIDEKTYRKQLEDINNANLMDLYYKQRANKFNPTFRGFGGFNYFGNMGPGGGFMNQPPRFNQSPPMNNPVNTINNQNNLYNPSSGQYGNSVNQQMNKGYSSVEQMPLNQQAIPPSGGYSGGGNVHVYNNNPYPNYGSSPNNYNQVGYGPHGPMPYY